MAPEEMSALPTRKVKIGEGQAIPPQCRKPILSFSPSCSLTQFKSHARELYSLQYYQLEETHSQSQELTNGLRLLLTHLHFQYLFSIYSSVFLSLSSGKLSHITPYYPISLSIISYLFITNSNIMAVNCSLRILREVFGCVSWDVGFC